MKLREALKLIKVSRSRQYTVRASPALSIEWSPAKKKEQVNLHLRATIEGEGGGTSTATTPKKQRKYQPVLIWLEKGIKSLQNESMLETVINKIQEKSKYLRKLQVEKFKSVQEVQEWLQSKNFIRSTLTRSLENGFIRIIDTLTPDPSSNGELDLSLLKTIKSHANWKKILYLFYGKEEIINKKLKCKLKEEGSSENYLTWSSSNYKSAIEFMSMEFQSSSHSLNFDPHGFFQQSLPQALQGNDTNAKTLSGVSKALKQRTIKTIHSTLQTSSTSKIIKSSSTSMENAAGGDPQLPLPGKLAQSVEVGPFYYFEIKIKKLEKNANISIGVTPRNVSKYDNGYLPGTKLGSYGLFNNGLIYYGDRDHPVQTTDNKNHASYAEGDVIGCGYDQYNKQLFWTKNGIYLGPAELNKSSLGKSKNKILFATVGFDNPSTIIEGNFGNQASNYYNQFATPSPPITSSLGPSATSHLHHLAPSSSVPSNLLSQSLNHPPPASKIKTALSNTDVFKYTHSNPTGGAPPKGRHKLASTGVTTSSQLGSLSSSSIQAPPPSSSGSGSAGSSPLHSSANPLSTKMEYFNGFLFDYVSFLEKRTCEHLTIKQKVKFNELHPFPELLFDSVRRKDGKSTFLIVAMISQFSLTLQILLKSYMEYSNGFRTVTIADNLRSSMVKDVTIRYVASLFPSKTFGFNLRNCSKLNPLFFDTMMNIERIRLLDLSGVTRMTDESAEKLSVICKNLIYIRVWSHSTDQTLKYISSIPTLQSLDLTDCKNITNFGIKLICKNLPNLLTLILDGCAALTDECLLFIIKYRKSLEKLQLDRCVNFTEKTLCKLVQHVSLFSISIAGNASCPMNVTDRLIEAICQYRSSNLFALNIYRSHVTDAALRLVAKSCIELNEINIGQINLLDASIASLSNLQYLARIDLSTSKVSDETILQFAKNLPIEEFAIQLCSNLSANGIAAIIPHLHKCKYLCLKLTAVDDKTLELLQDLSVMPKLKRLDVRRTAVSRPAIESVHQVKPHLIIYNESWRHVDRIIADGKQVSVWKYPTRRLTSVRSRKSSL